MGARYRSLRGFDDLLPGVTERWQRFEAAARDWMSRYGFREIRPPFLESTELFTRSVGAETDIVNKEMFTFEAGEESHSLRPELTASVCRAFVEHGLDRLGMNRLYYIGPCFRKERPQKGRLRQFHQVGAELFGESAPAADVESIALSMALVKAAGARSPRLLVNSIGDDACRPQYRTKLIEALRSRSAQLCEDCRGRIERAPLRVFDCKNPACKAAVADAPLISEHLCAPCQEHRAAVRLGLQQCGLDAHEDPRLVRGLDYYVRTTFEVQADTGGSQNAVLGGGRYDKLVEELGGPAIPGVGFAAGIERLLLAAGKENPAEPSLDGFLVSVGEAAQSKALALVQRLRECGVSVLWDPAGRALGNQMKRAGRSGARFALIVGDEELARGRFQAKRLSTGESFEVPGEASALAQWFEEQRG